MKALLCLALMAGTAQAQDPLLVRPLFTPGRHAPSPPALVVADVPPRLTGIARAGGVTRAAFAPRSPGMVAPVLGVGGMIDTWRIVQITERGATLSRDGRVTMLALNYLGSTAPVSVRPHYTLHTFPLLKTKRTDPELAW